MKSKTFIRIFAVSNCLLPLNITISYLAFYLLLNRLNAKLYQEKFHPSDNPDNGIVSLLQAIQARDALAKCIYSNLFDWIGMGQHHSIGSLCGVSVWSCGCSWWG